MEPRAGSLNLTITHSLGYDSFAIVSFTPAADSPAPSSLPVGQGGEKNDDESMELDSNLTTMYVLPSVSLLFLGGLDVCAPCPSVLETIIKSSGASSSYILRDLTRPPLRTHTHTHNRILKKEKEMTDGPLNSKYHMTCGSES
jgi:hypothetical protein